MELEKAERILALCFRTYHNSDACRCGEANIFLSGHAAGTATRQAEVDELKAAVKVLTFTVESLLDGLDENYDPEVGGLSTEEWDIRVAKARRALDETKGICESTKQGVEPTDQPQGSQQ